ncbi:MAG: recombination protein RecA [Acidobacteriaceae bacterium]|jgi:recombination protein RecA|nr:recombination protein RecA [Acidobacteriaceae bacterium]
MRSNLATLRSDVELSLAGRVVSPFGYRDRKSVETVLTGIPEIDALAGGFPRGALTEICGPPCSGRTTVLLSALASRTAEAEVCALIDARDSFDPRSAEAAGVELEQLLWVRCHGLNQSLRAADLVIQGGGFGFIALDLSDVAPETVRHVPLNAWFRFRRAVEDTSTVLLVLEQESNAKTCASLVLRMSMKGAKWSGTEESNVNDHTSGNNPGIKTAEISRHSYGRPYGRLAQECLPHEGLTQACLPHARLLDGSEVQAEMLHTRMQSVNFQRAQNGPVSIARHFAGHNSTDHRDENTQSFGAQSVWSYLHALPVETKLK